MTAAFPLTRTQLDVWLAQETGHSGTEWQLGVLVRFDGTVERDLLEQAIRHVLREAEPARAAIFEVDGQVFQRAIDYPDVEVAFFDVSDSRHPVQEARGIALSIQRTPMPSAGPLFKFALIQTWLDEFYLFACFHHIIIDGYRNYAYCQSDCNCLRGNCFWRTHSSCLLRLVAGLGSLRVRIRSVHGLSRRSGLLD